MALSGKSRAAVSGRIGGSMSLARGMLTTTNDRVRHRRRKRDAHADECGCG